MATRGKWYDPKHEAARAYMALSEVPESGGALRHLDPSVLDGVTRVAEIKSRIKPYGELHHLNATLTRLLRDEQLVSSETLQRSLRETYDRAETLAYPAAVGYRDLCHRLHGVTSSFHLQRMTLAQMQVLDELAITDDGATMLHQTLLKNLVVVQKSPDAGLVRSCAQVFEAFAEAWVYRKLSNCLKVFKIPETAVPSPDFRCELEGKEFFVEVKAPDIVDGDLHHERLMKAATEMRIELDEQIRAGMGIAMAAQSVAPFGKSDDPNCDAGDLTTAITILRERARRSFEARQFSSGPTFALMFVERYPIPGNRRSILPHYKVGGRWAAYDDRQSGVIWQAGFGEAGNVIHNLFLPSRLSLARRFCAIQERLFPAWRSSL